VIPFNALGSLRAGPQKMARKFIIAEKINQGTGDGLSYNANKKCGNKKGRICALLRSVIGYCFTQSTK
jgi:hypothetical protein